MDLFCGVRAFQGMGSRSSRGVCGGVSFHTFFPVGGCMAVLSLVVLFLETMSQ